MSSPRCAKNTGPPSTATVTSLGGDETRSWVTSGCEPAAPGARSPVTDSPGSVVAFASVRAVPSANAPSALTGRNPPPRSASSGTPPRFVPVREARRRRACSATSTDEDVVTFVAPQSPCPPENVMLSRNWPPVSVLTGVIVRAARVTTAPTGRRRSTSRRSRSNGSCRPTCRALTRIAPPPGPA